MKNWSIKFKVLIPIFVIALIGLLACIIGNISLKKVQQASNQISGDYMESTKDLDSLSNEFVILQKLILQHCLADDEGKKNIEVFIEKSKKSIIMLRDTYQNKLENVHDVKLFKEFKKQLKDYLDAYDLAISMSKSGNNEGAIRWTNNKLTELSDNMITELNQMKKLNDEKVSKAINKEKNLYQASMEATTGTLIVTIVLLILSIFICSKYIVKPINKTKCQLAQIVKGINEERGELTIRVEVKSRDEIGQLALGINTFIETLQRVLSNIGKSTDSMNEVVKNVIGYVDSANKEAFSISSVMEEMSATMEEVSSTISNINSDVADSDNEVTEIAAASEDINTYTLKMKERAESLEITAVQSKNTTRTMITGIVSALNQAIDNSKNVDQINQLTNDILSLSGRTKLLSLNASIEAARSGEAGKGFAVVADEIRKLSESTKITADKIQNINRTITDSVYELIQNSNTISDYVNDTVLKDYDSFVTTGEQYSKDAIFISDMMGTFREKTISLNKTMNSVTMAIGDISKTIGESSAGIMNTSTEINSFLGELNNVTVNMEINKNIARNLMIQSDKFITE